MFYLSEEAESYLAPFWGETVPGPTPQQRIAFGILCSMNVIMWPPYLNWCVDYFLGKGDSLHMKDRLLMHLGSDVPECQENVSSGFAAVESTIRLPELFSACAAHRAFHDSNGSVDLNRMAFIASNLTHLQIAEFFA